MIYVLVYIEVELDDNNIKNNVHDICSHMY